MKLSEFETVNSDAVKRLLLTIPSVSEAWGEHVLDWVDEEAGAYNDMAVIARHIHAKCPARPTRNNKSDISEFDEFFSELEVLTK